jgi:3-mercaptopyruvate sulfurtransferase SseA
MSNLVSTEWLAAHLGEVRVVDASWYMPDEKRQPEKEFEAGHIQVRCSSTLAVADPRQTCRT